MIEIKVSDAIAVVTLARPEKKNALNFEMFASLDKTIKQLRKRKDIRAVIINAKGDDFCTGLDVKSVMSQASQPFKLLFKWLPGNQNLAQRVVLGWQSLDLPVIAAIQGRCWGGGMQIALGADYRIASSDASLAIMEARWGLCPDMGASLLAASTINKDHYLKLASSANPVDALKAQQYGLVSEIADNPLAAATDLANELATRSPNALKAIKKLSHVAYRSHHRRLLAQETWQQVKLLFAKNTRIAMHNATHKVEEHREYQQR